MSDNLVAAKRDDGGRQESGEHDQDVAEDDVDHAAVAAEPAAVGAGQRGHLSRQSHQGGTAARPNALPWTSRDGDASFPPESLRSVPLFSRLPEAIVARMANRFKTEEVSLGQQADRRRART